MKLYGTVTSPYVRRVRIVAAELGEPVELVDTFTEEGQAALRAASPIWKVPAAELDGTLVLDSHAVVDALIAARGHGTLRPVRADWRWVESNVHHVVDGALDSLINVFYLAKDGVGPDQAPYLAKQRDRAAAALRWVEGALHGAQLTDEPGLGIVEIALITALEWMQFRRTYPVDAHPGLVAFLAAHAERPSVVATRPG